MIELSNTRVIFIGKDKLYLSILPKELNKIKVYEDFKREKYGQKYKSIIIDKIKPVIKVRYSLNQTIEKKRYQRVVLEPKYEYCYEGEVCDHWIILLIN